MNFENPVQIKDGELGQWVEVALNYSEVEEFLPWLSEWFCINQEQAGFVSVAKEVCDLVRGSDAARFHSIHRDLVIGLPPERANPDAIVSLMAGVDDDYKAEVGVWLLQKHNALTVIEPYLWCINEFASKAGHKEMDAVVNDVLSRFGGEQLRDFQFFTSLAYLLQGRVDRCNDVLSVLELGERLKSNDEATLLLALSCLSEGNSAGAKRVLSCSDAAWVPSVEALCKEWDGERVKGGEYYCKVDLSEQFKVKVGGTTVTFELSNFSLLFESFYRRVKWRNLIATSIVASSVLDSLVAAELFCKVFTDSVLMSWDEDMWYLAAQVRPYLGKSQRDQLRALLYAAWQKDTAHGKKAAFALFEDPVDKEAFSENILVAARAFQVMEYRYWDFVMANLPLERYVKQYVESDSKLTVELVDFFDLEMVKVLIAKRRDGTLGSIAKMIPQEGGWRVRLGRLANVKASEFIGTANLVLEDIRKQVPEHNLTHVFKWVYPFLLRQAKEHKQHAWAVSRQQELENFNSY